MHAPDASEREMEMPGPRSLELDPHPAPCARKKRLVVRLETTPESPWACPAMAARGERASQG